MKKIIIILTGVVILSGISCRKYVDVNSPNPNNPISVTPDILLAGALNSTVRIMDGTSSDRDIGVQIRSFDELGWWMGYWVVAGTYVPASLDLQYSEPNDYKQEVWANLYHNINDYKNIEAAGIANKTPFYIGVAKIMEAYNFQTLVDLYGNVPYSQAFRGTLNLHPKYDDQKSIYSSLVNQVDSGILAIKSDPNTASNPNDIMFQGNHGKWVRFANTIKLRMLTRQSEVAGIGSLVTVELNKVGTDGFMNPNEGAYVNPGYQNSTAKQSPFWATYGYTVSLAPNANNQYFKANQFAINFYQTNGDDRLGYFYSPGVGGKYFGGVFGVTGVPGQSGIGGNATDGGSSIQDPTKPNPSGLLQGSGQSAVLLSSFENQFLLAEAAFRGWISGNPQTYYEEGIKESFEYLKVKSADSAALAYYSQNAKNVGFVASSNKLEAIVTQKWAALNGISFLEPYNDWRRLNYPSNLPKSPQATSATIPRRFEYPQSEFSTNNANIAAQGTINRFTSKLFWDVH